jgi:hypothetical protein
MKHKGEIPYLSTGFVIFGNIFICGNAAEA